MIQIFDMFGNPEKPQIILTKPTGEKIFEIGTYSGLSINDKYNDISQLSFTVFKKSSDNYDEIKGKKYIEVENYGIYIIDDVVDTSNGVKESKKILCKSVDFELSYKRITLEPDIYQLYDNFSPNGTLLKRVIDLLPSWSIGTVDPAISGQYRYFDIEDKTLLQFIYVELEEAFQAVVEADYTNRTINLISVENAGSNSGIYLSHENLVKTISISELSNEIITNLVAYGGNGLTISGVNPSGNSTLTNLNYFKTTEWIDQGLIDALDNYQIVYDSKSSIYDSSLLDYKSKNEALLNLNTDLTRLNADLVALDTVRRERVQGGIAIGSLYNDIAIKQSEIVSKEGEISDKENELDGILDVLKSIVNDLSYENNFTESQIIDLDKYTIEYTYQNDAYIITDSMTAVDIQEQEELLMTDANKILARLSQPRFSFKVDAVDFLKLSDYSDFTKQFELSTIVYIELMDETVIETRLISYQHDWDSNKLTMEFTSKYRTNDPTYLYSELFKKSIDAGVSTSFSKSAWYDYKRNDKDNVTAFINSSLNASVNNVVSSVDQDVLMDSNGIRCRQSDGLGGYLGEQLWIVNNMIAFSDDNFQTARMALGKIQDSKYGEIYGLVGEVIVGKLLAGNNLRIENTANQFLLDENGATLTNATFTLDTTDNKGRIILDPNEGIRIQGNSTGTFQDAFYVGTDGRIKANKIDISGDGTFGGTVSAANIIGSNITAGTITGTDIISSTLTSAEINGGVINAVNMNSSTITAAEINGGIINAVNMNGTNILAGNLAVGTNMTISSTERGGAIKLLNNTISATSSNLNIFADRDMSMFITGDLLITADEIYRGSENYGNRLMTYLDCLSDLPYVNYKDGTGIDISGSKISIDRNYTDDRYCRNASSQEISLQVVGGGLEVFSNGSYQFTLTP